AEVRYTALGILNELSGRRRISGAVWFDDMRLTGPRREPGYGFQARMGLALSDLATLGVSFNYSDPNFRSFREGRGVKTGGFGTVLSASGTFNVDRLLPRGLGLVLPVSYALTRQRVLPKFSADYPDLRVNRAQAEGETGTSSSRDFSLDNVHKNRSSSPFLNYTLDALGGSWRRHDGGSRSALRRDTTSSSAWSCGYSISPDVKLRLGPETDLYVLPRGLRFAVSDAWNRTVSSTRANFGDTLHTDTLQGHRLGTDLSVDFSPLEDVNIDYGVETERDRLVLHPDTFLLLPVGSEVSLTQSIGASYDLEVGDVFTPSVELDGQYDHDRPKLDTIYAPYRNLGNSGELTLGAGLDLPELMRLLSGEDSRGRRTDAGDSGRAGVDLRRVAAAAADMLDPLDFNWSVARSSEYGGCDRPAPLGYRLGLTDTFGFDVAGSSPSRSRERLTSLRLSGGGRYKDLTVRASYDGSQGREAGTLGATLDRSTTWPSLDVGLSRLHMLFSRLATESRLSSTYRERRSLSGELVPCSLATGPGETLGLVGRVDTRTAEFNPLLSWSTTWKKRVTTSLSASYSTSSA
ncbi:hypothetical protein FJY71_09085, partial [candidate division WOR-3 bacterium]|nr:hypothetical protein [candidate division WOR-3 bacterium]